MRKPRFHCDRIGDVLVDLGYMTENQRQLVIEKQHLRPGKLFGRVAVELGILNEDQLVDGLADQLGLGTVQLNAGPYYGWAELAPDMVSRLSVEVARGYRVLPLTFIEGCLAIGTCDPQNSHVRSELLKLLSCEIRLYVATESEVLRMLDRYYPQGNIHAEDGILGPEVSHINADI